MIHEAVILGAGRGMRLRGVLDDRPKGFLEIGGRPIVERSLEMLLARGISRVVMATGFVPEYYEALAARHAGVVTGHNPKFAESGSMYSLYCVRELVRPPFLLLESDLVYEGRALDVLLDRDEGTTVLLSGTTGSGDEVWVEAPGGRLKAMSKCRQDVGQVAGELVGISRIDGAMFARMLEVAARTFQTTLHMEYEYCITEVGTDIPVRTLTIDDLLWGEVDDEHHYARITGDVFPRILKKDGQP